MKVCRYPECSCGNTTGGVQECEALADPQYRRWPLTNVAGWPTKKESVDEDFWRNYLRDDTPISPVVKKKLDEAIAAADLHPGWLTSPDDKPTLPTSIRVGYRDFKIQLWPKPKNDRYGECDKDLAVLSLNPDLEGDHQVYIVLHELFHAIHDTAGLSESSTEEQIVGAYSGFLLQVWRDNPGFRALMNGVV